MHPFRPYLALALLTFWAMGGCGGGAGTRAFAVVDSAGIRIAENGTAGTHAQDQWQLSAEPFVDIGVLEGAPEYQLFRVTGAVRLDDGRIVVANSGTHEVRFYDAEGRHLKSVGRDGDGPGEFRYLMRLVRLNGDTLAAFDSNLGRISWFTPGGNFLRAVSTAGNDAGLIPLIQGAFADGSFFGVTAFVFGAGDFPEGILHDSTLYLRIAPEGGRVDTLGFFQDADRYARAIDKVFFMTLLPFGSVPTAAVIDDRFYFGTGGSPEVGVYDESGRLLGLVRWNQTNRSVTQADVKREKARRLQGVSDPNARRRIESVFAEMPVPRTMPLFSSVVVDASERLWVGGYVAPGDTAREWRIFDRDGQLEGVSSTPAGLRVTQIGDDFILGIWSDDMGVEHVRLFSLIRSESRAG